MAVKAKAQEDRHLHGDGEENPGKQGKSSHDGKYGS
jgi:hypothetical protein